MSELIYRSTINDDDDDNNTVQYLVNLVVDLIPMRYTDEYVDQHHYASTNEPAELMIIQMPDEAVEQNCRTYQTMHSTSISAISFLQ